jgi:hypothetical protein
MFWYLGGGGPLPLGDTNTFQAYSENLGKEIAMAHWLAESLLLGNSLTAAKTPTRRQSADAMPLLGNDMFTAG